MRVLWPHNYDPNVPGAGIFMHQQAQAFRDESLQLDLYYMGNLRHPGDLIYGYKKLRKVSKMYDLIHSQFGSACGYVVSRLVGPKIMSLRGSDWYGCTSGALFSRIHGAFQKNLTRGSLNKYELITVMSNRMRNEIEMCYPTQKIRVVPSGIDLTKFQPMEKMKAREILGLPDDKTTWVFFPSIIESNSVKRPQLAKKAVLEAQKFLPDIKLKIGSGIPHNMMPLLYNASDVVLMTSTHEGWPNSIKEALACNVPFVCTDVSDLNLISKQERNCEVVPADAKVIGKAIVNVVAQERNENLRKHIEKMDLKIVTKKIYNLYKEVLSDHLKLEKR